MHVDTFEEVLYPETLATDMLDLAAVILVNGLHDQFDQQRRFASQLLQIDVQRVIGAVYRLPVMQEVRHLDRQFHRLVGILDIEAVIGPVLGNDRKVALAREITQGRLYTQHVFRAVGFRRQKIRRPQIDVTDGRGENHMHGLAERHLQRVGRDNPVESQRTGKTVVQIARGGLFLRVGSEHAPDKNECQKNLFHTR